MGKTVKINITLPEEQLKALDAFVQEEGDTRSSLIRRALKVFTNQEEKERRERERQRGMIKAASDIRELRKKSGYWDGVAEIRRWRNMQ